MNILFKIIKDSITSPDNVNFDNGRIICSLSFTIYYILAFYNAYLSHGWTAVEFASGCTAMAVGFGIKLHLTDKSIQKEDKKWTGKIYLFLY